MTNDYEVIEDGKAVAIWIEHEGKRSVFVIDAEDFDWVSSIPGAWLAGYDPKEGSRYVYTTEAPTQRRGRNSCLSLTR